MGATLLYLAIILARANAYSRASATLRMSGTVVLHISWAGSCASMLCSVGYDTQGFPTVEEITGAA